MKFLRAILTRDDHTADYPDDLGLLDADQYESGSDIDDWDEETNNEDFAAVLDRPVAAANSDTGAKFGEETAVIEQEPAATGEEPAPNEEGPTAEDSNQEIPIWELFEDEVTGETAPEVPEEPAAGDDDIKDLARSALEKLEGRNGPDHEQTPGGRTKTRLLGFSRGTDIQRDVFSKPPTGAPQAQPEFPVGWLVVIEGRGRGAQFTLFDAVAKIGRGSDQAISLNFGDQAISRDNHAAVAYDGEQNAFFLGHSGKANLVRLNGKPVLTTEKLANGDLIRIGETTLRLTTFCDAEFSWDLVNQDESDCA
ncbi:MAG: FHA domain-containing protein [Rhodobacter sp.]|nr:FHA domain-containing protein [Rhodobacter sp.]